VQGAAPGFIYASPWILMTTRNIFGSFPNLPLRIAEGVLGRLSSQQLAVLVVLHFACAVSTSFMLRYLTLADAYPLAFSLIEYSDNSPWLLVSAARNAGVMLADKFNTVNVLDVKAKSNTTEHVETATKTDKVVA
jgi:hypothetical protein